MQEKTLAELTEVGHVIVLKDNTSGKIYTGKYNWIYRSLRGVWVHTIAGKEIVTMCNGGIGYCTLSDNCDRVSKDGSTSFTILENKTLKIKA